jgi:hypothetical protein
MDSLFFKKWKDLMNFNYNVFVIFLKLNHKMMEQVFLYWNIIVKIWSPFFFEISLSKLNKIIVPIGSKCWFLEKLNALVMLDYIIFHISSLFKHFFCTTHISFFVSIAISKRLLWNLPKGHHWLHLVTFCQYMFI